MARKRTTKAKVAAAATVEQTESVSFQNLGIEWKPRPDGSAELRVAYEGPLASRDEVIARAGRAAGTAAPSRCPSLELEVDGLPRNDVPGDDHPAEERADVDVPRLPE